MTNPSSRTLLAAFGGAHGRTTATLLMTAVMLTAATTLWALWALWTVSPTAAQGTAELCESSGVEQFSDVADSDYAAAYILCAKALGLTKGTTSGDFDADGKLSRAQMAAFLARLWRDVLGRECPSEPTHDFTDTAENFAANDIACLFALGITKGTTSTTYSPSVDLKTSQVTRFVARLINKANPGTCVLSGGELTKASDCLAELNIAPDAAEAASTNMTPRSQMAVYLIGAWYHTTGKGQPPEPPALLQTTTGFQTISSSRRADRWCVITGAGDAVCWGNNWDGVSEPSVNKYKSISVGESVTCGITTANDAVCWGYGDDAVLNPPAGKYKSISVAAAHACGVTTAGDAKCWYDKEYGYWPGNPPPGKYTMVSTSGDPTSSAPLACGITTAGDAVCWGAIASELPEGRYTDITVGESVCAITAVGDAVCAGESSESDLPAGKYKTISVGNLHACGITTAGDAVCDSNFGDRVMSCATSFAEAINAPAGKFKAITANSNCAPMGVNIAHSCAITAAGDEVVCWGAHPDGSDYKKWREYPSFVRWR